MQQTNFTRNKQVSHATNKIHTQQTKFTYNKQVSHATNKFHMEPRISTPFGKAQDVDQFTELPVTFYTSGFIKVIAHLVEKFSN